MFKITNETLLNWMNNGKWSKVDKYLTKGPSWYVTDSVDLNKRFTDENFKDYYPIEIALLFNAPEKTLEGFIHAGANPGLTNISGDYGALRMILNSCNYSEELINLFINNCGTLHFSEERAEILSFPAKIAYFRGNFNLMEQLIFKHMKLDDALSFYKYFRKKLPPPVCCEFDYRMIKGFHENGSSLEVIENLFPMSRSFLRNPANKLKIPAILGIVLEFVNSGHYLVPERHVIPEIVARMRQDDVSEVYRGAIDLLMGAVSTFKLPEDVVILAILKMVQKVESGKDLAHLIVAAIENQNSFLAKRIVLLSKEKDLQVKDAPSVLLAAAKMRDFGLVTWLMENYPWDLFKEGEFIIYSEELFKEYEELQ